MNFKDFKTKRVKEIVKPEQSEEPGQPDEPEQTNERAQPDEPGHWRAARGTWAAR